MCQKYGGKSMNNNQRIRQRIAETKLNYPPGTRLELIHMDLALMILPLLITLVPGGVIEINSMTFKRIFPQYVQEEDKIQTEQPG